MKVAPTNSKRPIPLIGRKRYTVSNVISRVSFNYLGEYNGTKAV